ncbi:MAG: flagellar biosynthesis protein FlhB [Planctomycetota bacterium]
MAESDGDKSQEATPHRRQQAREQGQVARSQDLASAALLLAALMILWLLSSGLVNYCGHLVRSHLDGPVSLSMDVGACGFKWNQEVGLLARYVLPFLGLVAASGIFVNLLQVGFLFLPEKLAPDISRIDPLQGFKRVFSLASAVRLAFGVFKLVVVGAVAYTAVWAERNTILNLSEHSVGEIGVILVSLLFWTTVKIGIALLVLAVFDYLFQWWKHERDIRMTPQEIREEMKNLEGNPQVISRRRQVQRQLAMNRMSSAVPKADVVITNPTELAVAVQYDPETMAAPVVVAKGAGVVAQRIRQLALENGVPIVERKPLAQALYREVEVNHPVPQDKYAAVAEVLAYVYQLKGKSIPDPGARR